jgi:hypothetical protein
VLHSLHSPFGALAMKGKAMYQAAVSCAENRLYLVKLALGYDFLHHFVLCLFLIALYTSFS